VNGIGVKGNAKWWRRLGRVERVFLILLVLCLALYLTGAAPALAWPAGIVTFLVGLAAAFQLSRRLMRMEYWKRSVPVRHRSLEAEMVSGK
jgi:hypothetical protein